MDAMSMMQVPTALAEGIADGFRDLAATDEITRMILATVFEFLGEEEIHRQIAERLDAALPDLLPQDTYDRRVALREIVEAVCHVLGER